MGSVVKGATRKQRWAPVTGQSDLQCSAYFEYKEHWCDLSLGAEALGSPEALPYWQERIW